MDTVITPARTPPSASVNVLFFGFCLAITTLFCGPLFADTVSVAPIADSYLRQFSPDVNSGGDFSNVAGTLGPMANREIRRIVMRFDLNNVVPAGAIINLVTLQMNVVMIPQTPSDSYFDLHRLLKPWGEMDVTWNSASAANRWEVAGAEGASDSVGNPSSTALVSGYGPVFFVSSDSLVADVQAWVANPAANYGWLMMSEDEVTPQTARRFGAREDPVSTPQLTIDYSMPSLSIATQPKSQTNQVGSSVSFDVVAAGTPPFAYQWLFNGNPLPGETNDTLVLSNIQTNQAGPYVVIVSNQTGTTNSDPAILTVEPPPPGVPVVNLTSPTNGAKFRALANVLLTADASESNGVIQQIEFFLGTNSVGVISNASGSVLSTSLSAGSYAARAVATDDTGKTGTSFTVNFSVVDPPGVTLTAPVAGSRFPVGSNLTVTASVSTKGAKILNVEFFAARTNASTGLLETVSIGSATNLPYTITWLPAGPGDYFLTALVTDEVGQTGQSLPVFVRIFVPELILPTVTITNGPANFAHVSDSPVTLAGSAADNIGLDHIEFQVVNGPFLSVTGSVSRAVGTLNWLAEIPLAPGKNLVRIQSVDLANNKSAGVIRIYTHTTTGPLVVQVNGAGKVSPDLNGRSLQLGKIYTLHAIPARGNLFLGWEGASPTNNPVLNFEMKSNLVLTANFVPNLFPAIAGAYTGVFFDADPNRFRAENAGLFRLQLAGSGSFSGRAVVQEGAYGFHGRFDALGRAQLSINRRALPPLAFALQADLINQTDAITGTVTTAANGNLLTSPLVAERNVFNSATNPATQAGRHGFGLQGSNADGPQAIATGTVELTRSGGARVHGSFLAKQNFNFASALSKNGTVPFFLSLGQGKDVLAGWLSFDANGEAVSPGQIYWTHGGGSGVTLLDQTPP